ncbi:potassium-transporting ATPase subunit KdpC [Pollutimonas sp. H1-120]|uniref:potassium-transporting ATPase subunit KdpC n=1 Tax=Pollutimonas sp. H1-120 TaxID=3148824 RepID=UPI003B52293F
MKTTIRPALVLFAALTLICGVLYPLAMAGIGQLAFPGKVAGSLIIRDGTAIGSKLIGQTFTSVNYFWGRPSATGPMPANAAASGGSNLGPSNPGLIEAVKSRIEALNAADPGNASAIPVDLATASASGLDPEISLAAAYYQAPRVARERRLTLETVHGLIAQHSESQYFGFLGEPRVNVLALNLALDQQHK